MAGLSNRNLMRDTLRQSHIYVVFMAISLANPYGIIDYMSINVKLE